MIKTAVGSADINLTLESISQGFGLILTGEVRDLAGILNSSADYAVQRMEEAVNIASAGDWGYYAGRVADSSSRWFKVWVRWNLETAVYDYYLEAEAGTVFGHATPYAGTLY